MYLGEAMITPVWVRVRSLERMRQLPKSAISLALRADHDIGGLDVRCTTWCWWA